MCVCTCVHVSEGVVCACTSLCVNEWSGCVCLCMYGREFGRSNTKGFVSTPTTGRSRQMWEEYVCHRLLPILPPTHMHAHYTSTLTNAHMHTHHIHTPLIFARAHAHTHITFHSLTHSDTHAHAHTTLTIF